MENWYPIDLHMHTVVGVTRNKKSDEVFFTYTLFQKVINKYKFGLMAVTNHNIIDMSNYILMRYLCKLNQTNLLLGVELDSKMSMGAAIHIATIFNSNNFDNNYLAMKEINIKTKIKKEDCNCDEIIYSDEDIVELLSKYDTVLIPHGEKARGIFNNPNNEQIDEALKKISEGFIRVFDTPSRWKMEQIKCHLDNLSQDDLDEFGGVLFSDNRNWSDYQRRYKNFFMNAEPTFKGLLHAITNPTKRFCKGDEIRRNTNYISKIIIHQDDNGGRLGECEINLSPYYNCVIGKSGSGKSLLLHLIKKHLCRNTQDNASNYEAFNKYQIEFRNENNEVLSADKINIGIGENLFDKIIQATTTKDKDDLYKIAELLNSSFKPREHFNNYKKKYLKKIENFLQLKRIVDNNTSELTIALVKFDSDIKNLLNMKDIVTFDIGEFNEIEISYNDSSIQEFKKYETELDVLKSLASIYKGEYLKQINSRIFELKKYFRLALLDINNTIITEKLDRIKVILINETINRINGNRSSQAKIKNEISYSLPISRKKIVDLVKSKYLNTLRMESINFSFNINEINTVTTISNDRSVKVMEYFKREDFETFNIRNNSIFKTYGKRSDLESKNYNLTKRDEAYQVVKQYVEIGLLSLESFGMIDEFNPRVKLLFNDQDVMQLNPGDIAKKYISIYFEDNLSQQSNNVVLYDQIENDVDKPFINETIRTLIENTKGRVQTIIVTHDPIVAVNADPNKYIISSKNVENQIITYRDFTIESEVQDEVETISNVVDGSKRAIRKRYEIYKGDNLHD